MLQISYTSSLYISWMSWNYHQGSIIKPIKRKLASVIMMLCISSLRFWLPFLFMTVVETWSFNARLLWILTSGSMWWSCTRTGKVEEVGDGYDVVKVRWATLDRHKSNKHGVPSKAFGMPSRTCAKNIRKSIECRQRFLINYCNFFNFLPTAS